MSKQYDEGKYSGMSSGAKSLQLWLTKEEICAAIEGIQEITNRDLYWDVANSLEQKLEKALKKAEDNE